MLAVEALPHPGHNTAALRSERRTLRNRPGRRPEGITLFLVVCFFVDYELPRLSKITKQNN